MQCRCMCWVACRRSTPSSLKTCPAACMRAPPQPPPVKLHAGTDHLLLQLIACPACMRARTAAAAAGDLGAEERGRLAARRRGRHLVAHEADDAVRAVAAQAAPPVARVALRAQPSPATVMPQPGRSFSSARSSCGSARTGRYFHSHATARQVLQAVPVARVALRVQPSPATVMPQLGRSFSNALEEAGTSFLQDCYSHLTSVLQDQDVLIISWSTPLQPRLGRLPGKDCCTLLLFHFGTQTCLSSECTCSMSSPSMGSCSGSPGGARSSCANARTRQFSPMGCAVACRTG